LIFLHSIFPHTVHRWDALKTWLYFFSTKNINKKRQLNKLWGHQGHTIGNPKMCKNAMVMMPVLFHHVMFHHRYNKKFVARYFIALLFFEKKQKKDPFQRDLVLSCGACAKDLVSEPGL
jgi:hypothetical protein